MEYCPHCRAMRRARKTTRTRQEVRDGQEVTLRVHTYACGQCSRVLYTNEQVMQPVAPAADGASVPAGDDAGEAQVADAAAAEPA